MNVGACPAAPRSMRLAQRLRQALPPVLPTLGGAIGWGIAAGVCALSGLMLDDWQTPAKIRAVFLLFALGGFVAFPFGLYLARLLSQWRQTGETAFAAAFVALTLTTIAATAALYGLQYSGLLRAVARGRLHPHLVPAVHPHACGRRLPVRRAWAAALLSRSASWRCLVASLWFARRAR